MSDLRRLESSDPVQVVHVETVRYDRVNRVGLGRTGSDLVMEPLGQRVGAYRARLADPVGGLLTQRERERDGRS